jgi:hypothetical protein
MRYWQFGMTTSRSCFIWVDLISMRCSKRVTFQVSIVLIGNMTKQFGTLVRTSKLRNAMDAFVFYDLLTSLFLLLCSGMKSV